jgi:hypothetical protein
VIGALLWWKISLTQYVGICDHFMIKIRQFNMKFGFISLKNVTVASVGYLCYPFAHKFQIVKKQNCDIHLKAPPPWEWRFALTRVNKFPKMFRTISIRDGSVSASW